MARGAFEMVPLSADDVGMASGGGDAAASTGPTAKRKWVRWTGTLKQAFLDHLSSTCNVSGSARAIGVDPASVYSLRRKDREFANGWDAALQLGYQMLETRLVGFVLSGGVSEAVPSDTADGSRFDPDQALRALTMHRQTMQGRVYAKRGGPPRRRATREETDALLKKQLDMLAKRLRAEGA